MEKINKHDSPTNVFDPVSEEKAFDLGEAEAGNFVLPIKDWLWGIAPEK